MTAPSRLHVESFFDPATFTFSHIVWDQATAQCVTRQSRRDSGDVSLPSLAKNQNGSTA
jgi:hypothetical protein